MSDFNMPPGVSSNDIPGNRPEDQIEQLFWQELDDEFVKRYGNTGHHWLEWQELADSDDLLFEYVKTARDIAYNKGWQDGINDEHMSNNYKDDICTHKWRDYDKIGVVCRDCGKEASPEIAQMIRGE